MIPVFIPAPCATRFVETCNPLEYTRRALGRACGLLCGILILSANSSAAPETNPQPLFQAQYEGKYSGMTIKSERKLSRNADGSYRLDSEVKNFIASIRESSEFELSATSQLQPQRYEYARKVLGYKAYDSIDFDWQQQQADTQRKDKPKRARRLALEGNELDPALYQLQLQADLYNGKTELSYRVAKTNKIKSLAFEIVGKDVFTLAETAHNTLKIVLINPDNDKNTTIWVIPDLSYQIAKIEHVEENGDTFTIRLTGFNQQEVQLHEFYRKTRNN